MSWVVVVCLDGNPSSSHRCAGGAQGFAAEEQSTCVNGGGLDTTFVGTAWMLQTGKLLVLSKPPPFTQTDCSSATKSFVVVFVSFFSGSGGGGGGWGGVFFRVVYFLLSYFDLPASCFFNLLFFIC